MADFNKTFFQKNETTQPKWHVIDAEGQVLGRIATRIADILRGKDKPQFTSHIDNGDYVVVVNIEKVVLTGDKWNQKEYRDYSGYRSGLKIKSAGEVLVRNPESLMERAVWGMLPKNILSRQILKKLKVYTGPNHPHKAQVDTSAAAE
jgi:large subunit ribosomal protein L13